MRLLILLLLPASLLHPQPVPSAEVHRAGAPVVIDGTLKDPAWKAASTLTLIFPWDRQTGAKQRTTVRILWDDQALYLGYDCEDTGITAQFDRRDDPTYRDDAVELFINPDPSQSFYYGFEMNARAVLFDYFYAFPYKILRRYDLPGVKLATHLRGTLNATGDKDSGWSLEVAIPWSSFEELGSTQPPKPGASWTANLNRWDGTEPNRRLSQWSNSGMPEPNPHNPARFGRLTFVP